MRPIDTASITSITRPARRTPRTAHTATVIARTTTSATPAPAATASLPPASRATSAPPYQEAPANVTATSIPYPTTIATAHA